MNRLFDDVLRGGVAGGGGQGGGIMLAPQMDVRETEKDIQIHAELPGVTEKDIEVSLNEDVLTLRAEKKQDRNEDRGGLHLSERSYGTFQRSIRLPFPVNADQVQAHFDNGVLKVTLPKSQPQQRMHKIQVHAGQSSQASQITGDQPSNQASIAGNPSSNGQSATEQKGASASPH
jgi:HSP20 family protein